MSQLKAFLFTKFILFHIRFLHFFLELALRLTVFLFLTKFNLCYITRSLKKLFIFQAHVVTPFNYITKTRLYNFDPLKPHCYIVKLGFTGLYIIFLISAQKHRLWVLVRTASSRRFLRVPTIYALSRNIKKKYLNFCFENFPILVVKFSIYLNRRVFVIGTRIPYVMRTRFRMLCRNSLNLYFLNIRLTFLSYIS